MRFYFRGLLIFSYDGNCVSAKMHKDGVPNFNMCVFGKDDYHLIAKYFETVERHKNGEEVELKDIQI